uniref:NECAP PHear domain-containing protein n=1 Tax=Sundstroemia setigera TaxID=3005 RepID=A0A6V6WJJ5_9STRA|mmetsp:Transcript_4/g.3  ORF Transcript_4/g.3 Transcript_4/m.3 type:complete len:278 (+) Transcript_4:130-963(+)|eukprot:CAMPEP_0178965958 /NCGR_PEP_ID=MMETSP0789-20121207/16635_1 /TAXON_ID=3005 /ORGANISM="Rhizosolenia setigera, Strain CCMP 1694" /LENGTH=277 /DNA_ID=CAMNT_0020651129 /DNA_START=61 /DNA_END=894 /DNA_ORIENTATION=+
MASSTEDKVVITHKILNIQECFIYRIPPMNSSRGHRAEDWNLASPLATCALDMIQEDDSLIIQLLANRPKSNGPKGATEQYLFAQAIINIKEETSNKNRLTMSHWTEPVTDSSRYFVLRIIDGRSKREAYIGIGFRERSDATSFRMGMDEYERSIKREIQLEETDLTAANNESETSQTDNVTSTSIPSISNLSLKDGEKIHINIKTPNSSGSTRRDSTGKKLVGKGGLLLKKPPPPGATIKPAEKVTIPPPDEKDIKEEGEAVVVEEEDDDEWGDFQ